MDALKKKVESWEVKYGQIAITGNDYEAAKVLFRDYFGRTFELETFKGNFPRRHFLYYEARNFLRLACKPFFGGLNAGDVIYLKPIDQNRIEVLAGEPAKAGRDEDANLLPKEKDEAGLVQSLANYIVGQLKERQFRSDYPTDFEEAINRAFVFLGFEGELIGGKGDTDVLLMANIGQESFKVNVDGKTSKLGKIMDQQIDWISLRDHRKKNKANFVIVIGPSFAGGNLEQRAKEYDVSLLRTDHLAQLVEAHSKFPFTLTELKDLFTGEGDKSSEVEDLLTQNLSRRNLLEQFRVIIEEMQALQDRLGYFTFDSLAGREKIEELEIEPQDIEYIITLLRLPFINGLKEILQNKFILTIRIEALANIFRQISDFLLKTEEVLEPTQASVVEDKLIVEKKLGSKYFKWYKKGHSIIAVARKGNPYEHYCPLIHFQTILEKITEAFKIQNLVNTDMISSILEGKDLSSGRPFKGKPELYKIRMALGILEIEGLIKWTGSKRPVEFRLNVQIDQIDEWIDKNIRSG